MLVQGGPAVAGAAIGGFAAGTVPESLLIGLAGALVTWQAVELAQRAQRMTAPRPSNSSGGPAVGAGMVLTPGRGALEGVAGFGIGLLGGMVGLILGTLRLPALIGILQLDPRVAAGTNLVIGTFLGLAGWMGHATIGEVDYPLLAIMGIVAMGGTLYGTRLTGSLSLPMLLRLMAAVLAMVGVLLLYRALTG